MQDGAGDLPFHHRHRVREVLRAGAGRQQDDIEQDIGDADRRDHGRGAGDPTQRTQRDALDDDADQTGREHRHEKGEGQHPEQFKPAKHRALSRQAEQLERPGLG